MKARILYEDEQILAVDKSAGELVVSDRWGVEPKENILLHRVGEYLREQGHALDSSGRDLYPLHRLDRETSGIVLFAKNQEAHKKFSHLFEMREMHKVYWTFVIGVPSWDCCKISLPLLRAEGKKGRGRAVVHIKNGQEAITKFSVIETFRDISWIEAQPQTGKLHQIRVHLRVLGHPLIKDEQYGLENWKSGAYPNLQIARMPLHARFLRFTHPFTGEAVEISSPLDQALRELVSALKQK